MPTERRRWTLVIAAEYTGAQLERAAWSPQALEAALRERLGTRVRMAAGAPPDEVHPPSDNWYFALETGARLAPREIMEAIVSALSTGRAAMAAGPVHATLLDGDWRQIGSADVPPAPDA
jgi:hypothetical protein